MRSLGMCPADGSSNHSSKLVHLGPATPSVCGMHCGTQSFTFAFATRGWSIHHRLRLREQADENVQLGRYLFECAKSPLNTWECQTLDAEYASNGPIPMSAANDGPAHAIRAKRPVDNLARRKRSWPIFYGPAKAANDTHVERIAWTEPPPNATTNSCDAPAPSLPPKSLRTLGGPMGSKCTGHCTCAPDLRRTPGGRIAEGARGLIPDDLRSLAGAVSPRGRRARISWGKGHDSSIPHTPWRITLGWAHTQTPTHTFLSIAQSSPAAVVSGRQQSVG